MTATPRSGNDAMLLADDAMPPNQTLAPLGTRSVTTVTTTLCSGGDDNIIGEIATPFGSRSMTLMLSLATTPRQLATTPFHRLLTMTPRLATSRATTTPRSAMTQCLSTTRFDLLPEKIRAVHQAINPVIFLLDSDNLEQSAVNVASAVGRKVKSLFMEGLGKRKIIEVDRALLSAFSTAATQGMTNSTSTTPAPTSAKQHNVGATVTPATTLTIRLLSRMSTTPASNGWIAQI